MSPGYCLSHACPKWGKCEFAARETNEAYMSAIGTTISATLFFDDAIQKCALGFVVGSEIVIG